MTERSAPAKRSVAESSISPARTHFKVTFVSNYFITSLNVNVFIFLEVQRIWKRISELSLLQLQLQRQQHAQHSAALITATDIKLCKCDCRMRKACG